MAVKLYKQVTRFGFRAKSDRSEYTALAVASEPGQKALKNSFFLNALLACVNCK